MSALIRANKLRLQWSEHPLFDDICFDIHARDRIAIIGRNGAGKSTLLKLLQGSAQADSGQLEQQPGLRIATMQQTVPQHLTGSTHDFVNASFDSDNDWSNHEIDKALSLVNIDPTWQMDALSGGQIRRVLLAAALVNDPDILLLDEPTNHLDIESIEWLEKFLINSRKTLVLITHDRAFMQRVATRIFELDIGQLTCWNKSYQDFLTHKAQQLTAEQTAQANFDKKLAQEETWIRQGIKARRTRNEGRVRALKQMREQFKQRRQRQGNLSLQQQNVEYAGKITFDIQDITLKWDGRELVKHFSSLVLRGDKIGILGANGCGKSTLIQCLLGEIKPQQGHVKAGTQLQVAYFDQHRAALDPEQSVIDNISGGRERITINGESKHIISYCQDFLFSAQTARSLVKTLSGGEQNRVLLAKILSQPSNVLVLDEPTNDLDMETLELLEDYLLNYNGTLLLISHDRSLLNDVVTSTWVFEGDQHIQEYAGGYDDYLSQRKQLQPSQTNKTAPKAKATPQEPSAKPKKLSYKLQRELDQLPKKIEQLETDIEALQQQLADPKLYQEQPDRVKALQSELQQLESDLECAFERWQELEQS